MHGEVGLEAESSEGKECSGVGAERSIGRRGAERSFEWGGSRKK